MYETEYFDVPKAPICLQLAWVILLIQAGLRRGGLVPAAGSAYACNDSREWRDLLVGIV